MTTVQDIEAADAARRTGRVKCVVWDLDGTLWDGVLLEDRAVRLRPEAVEVVKALDARGILHSVASRNDHDAAWERLTRFGLADYFLHPQISWGPKSESVARVAQRLNIGVDALAFVDDQDFERAEVAYALPGVLCRPADRLGALLDEPEFSPRFVTADSARRRAMYRSSIERDHAEHEFRGTSEEFLATLDMRMTISRAGEADLQRAEELTVRTNQLNSTGVTYSYAELDRFRTSGDHLLLVAGLADRFGSYGTIGLALVETAGPAWRLKLLLMSCRVMSRGLGGVLLNHVMRLARDRGRDLVAEFAGTGRNRAMYVTYRFAGFTEAGRDGDRVLLRADLSRITEPRFLRLHVDQDAG